MTDENNAMNYVETVFPTAKSLILIGAMDGIAFEEFYPFIMKWGNNLEKAVFVEPIPWWFDKLKETYREFPHFEYENSAISLTTGTQRMIAIDPNKHSNVDGCLFGCSIFGDTFTNLLNITDAEVEHLKDRLIVPTLSFEDLLQKYNIESIDLLKIDTEGQDWNILKQVDLNKFKPMIIVYEALHLSMEDKENAREYCLSHGYEIIQEDSIVVLKK